CKGASDIPRLYSGRILIFTLSQFALLLFQLYSASVVSSLLIKPPSDIRNLKDLVRSDLEFGCEDLKYVRDLFNTTNIQVLKELKGKKLKEANYMPPKEGLALVNKGTFAYHTELKTAYPMIERTFSNTHVCDLQFLKLVRDANLYTNYQKSSPFRDMMNVCIRRLDETGLTDHLQKEWGFRKPVCFREPYLAASVGINEFLPLATLLFVGYLISCLILIVEIYSRQFTVKNSRKLELKITK
ncbi:ionotropic receptor 75a-like, partial [Onthophagus taurus]|uniref:ionotropic receptor 75a-like n=1 Tax=Onthophagus taurus TaxID=166361 RepID=UPI0039BE0C31